MGVLTKEVISLLPSYITAEQLYQAGQSQMLPYRKHHQAEVYLRMG